MLDTTDFTEQIRLIRAGDRRAAEDMVKLYEPEILVALRIWLRMQQSSLRRAFDSVDVCQAVLFSFFVRAAAGQYDLDRPENLRNLLIAMARNKLAEQIKGQHRDRRDIRRVQLFGPEPEELAAAGDTPSEIVGNQELLVEIRNRLTPAEVALVDRWSHGEGWAEIAAEMGGTAESCRKQLARAIARVRRELGLEEPLPA